MKNDFDKELDSLLRGHTATARRDAASSRAQQPAGGASSRGERASSTVAQSPSHLDADELNAYAENALPASTRARYMAHLADCDSCRKIATDIALAAGVAGELEKRAAVPGHAAAASVATWRERLAAIFAPRVLRYVAPALAVLFVGVIGLVALRQSNDLSPVASKSETAGESPNVATTQTDSVDMKQSAPSSPSSSPSASVPTNPNEVAKTREPATIVAPGAVGSAAGSGSQPAPRTEILADAPPPPPGETASKRAGPPAAASAPEDFAANKSEELSSAVNQQRDAAQNSTAQNSVTINEQEYSRAENNSRATQSAEVNRADTGDYDSPRRGGQRAGSQSRSRTAPSADKSIEEAGADIVEAPAPKPSSEREGRQLAKGARKQNASKTKKDDREADESTADETRAVAGRRFRRQSGVWIDTAFNSARALINVRRGSEQFRSLVADEQGLRSIANQLPGEVIVVWKNRAYRIQ